MSRISGRNLMRALPVLVACISIGAHGQQTPARPGGYPTKPIRLLVGNAPGGGIDITARVVGQRRIVLLLSALCMIGWISWVGVQSNWFSEIQPLEGLIMAGGLIVAYFIPQLLCKVTYWVIDGFEKDKTS